MTTTFTDTRGRTWDLSLTIATVRRVKAQAGVDLLNVQDQATFAKLVYDPEGLAQTLWVIVEPAARAAGVDAEGFAEALGGDTLVSATDALLEAITGFFRPAQRAPMRTALAKHRELEEAHAQWTTGKIATQPMPDFAALIASGDSSTTSPAPSASTPAR